MRPCCTECRYRFEREPGHFVGAMYFSYFLGLVTLLPVSLPLFATGVSSWWIATLAVVQMLLLSPLVFRYSRSLWMGFDLVFSHIEEKDYDDETSEETAP